MATLQRHQPKAGREGLDRAADAWARAEHDADDAEILHLLADDVVLVVVGLDQADLHGRRAVGTWHREQAANALHERDLPVQRVHGWSSVLDDVVRESRVTGRLYGFRGEGRRVRYRLRRLFELHDGRVTRLTVWPDLEALARQLG
jgi:ketosteroid isomerase-like protein